MPLVFAFSVRSAFGLAALLFVVHAQAFTCPRAPDGIKDIKGLGYYTDAAHSVVNEVQRIENVALIKPFESFNRKIADMSDQYIGKKDPAVGACAIAWLDRWARDEAMLGKMVHVNNDQADYYRQWLHGGFAIVYLKTQETATAEQRVRIEAWLKEIAVRNLAYWNNPKLSHNNHYYWTGVGIMATAIATKDEALLKTARAIYDKGIDDIADDGSMPMEMARGRRAFHYHNFALDPLVMIAEMANSLGQDWYGYKNWRIDLLADRVVQGYRDPAWFTQRSGTPQEAARPNNETGWVEFYRLRASRPERFDELHKLGPFREPRLGGNITLMAQTGIFNPK